LLLLSMDTATDVATACLWRDGAVVYESLSRGRSTAAQRLLGDVHHLLESAGSAPQDIDAIVVGTGPGTFTGLRIGLASARALGFALGAPVHGVCTLEALLRGDGVDVACIDARRGEVFCVGAGLEIAALKPADLAGRIAPGAVVAGDGAVRYRDLLEAAGAVVPPDDSPLHVPWARHHAGMAESWGAPEPIYVRAPDADSSPIARAAS
jgi:tRNA threonylcarbamoyl adenosine modification protein YeaZ